MAAWTLSFGMLPARAFCNARRRAGLLSGLVPPAFTAMAMSLLIRVNSFAILFQRANIVVLRVSKMRPMAAKNAAPSRQGPESMLSRREPPPFGPAAPGARRNRRPRGPPLPPPLPPPPPQHGLQPADLHPQQGPPTDTPGQSPAPGLPGRRRRSGRAGCRHLPAPAHHGWGAARLALALLPEHARGGPVRGALPAR